MVQYPCQHPDPLAMPPPLGPAPRAQLHLLRLLKECHVAECQVILKSSVQVSRPWPLQQARSLLQVFGGAVAGARCWGCITPSLCPLPTHRTPHWVVRMQADLDADLAAAAEEAPVSLTSPDALQRRIEQLKGEAQGVRAKKRFMLHRLQEVGVAP